MADKSLLQYYLQELTLLEDDCAAFSTAYPAVAANLGLGSEGTSDAHVRQLIEAVAFIAARLKRHMDGASGEVAYGLLQSLAPHLVVPLPAMSVARFTPRSPQLEPVASRPPAAVRLQAAGASPKEIQFTMTGQAVALWPLQLRCDWGGDTHTHARTPRFPPGVSENDYVLTLEHPSKPIAAGDPGELTFFVSGPLNRAMAAVEALACGATKIRLMPPDGSWSVPLAPDSLEVLGFETSQRLLPVVFGGGGASAQALELLNFPRRFCFFRVRGLRCPEPARVLHLVFSVEQSSRAALDVVRQNIHLNCVPVLNLFRHSPVALNLKGRRDEYLIPRPFAGRGGWDVFSVDRVRLVARESEREIHEFHAGAASVSALEGEPYWQGIRRDRASAATSHASLGMRFINLDRSRTGSGEEYETAMLDLMLTQCNEPASLTAGQSLATVGWECGYQATLEFAPTAYVDPVLPASDRVPGLLKALQWRTSGDADLTAMVRQYLAAHDRSGEARARELLKAIAHIEREVAAMPWPGLGAGALVMGCRYELQSMALEQAPGAEFLLPRVMRSILSQTHDLPVPMEVAFKSAARGARLVH